MVYSSVCVCLCVSVCVCVCLWRCDALSQGSNSATHYLTMCLIGECCGSQCLQDTPGLHGGQTSPDHHRPDRRRPSNPHESSRQNDHLGDLTVCTMWMHTCRCVCVSALSVFMCVACMCVFVCVFVCVFQYGCVCVPDHQGVEGTFQLIVPGTD